MIKLIVSLFLYISLLTPLLADPVGELTTDSPCILESGEKKCDVQLTVKHHTARACIWLVQPTLKLFSCQGHNTWQTTWGWTNLIGQTLELRAHKTWPVQDPNWPESMLSVFNDAKFLDQKRVVAVEQEPPGRPRLDSGETTCSDDYCILLTGANFQKNAYVEVRTIDSDKVIATYRGESLTRIKDTNLQLIITNAAQRRILNESGLIFSVVNPSESQKYESERVLVERELDEPPCSDWGWCECEFEEEEECDNEEECEE